MALLVNLSFDKSYGVGAIQNVLLRCSKVHEKVLSRVMGLLNNKSIGVNKTDSSRLFLKK